MTGIPRDPVMLLSYINTQLRDFYPCLLYTSENAYEIRFSALFPAGIFAQLNCCLIFVKNG